MVRMDLQLSVIEPKSKCPHCGSSNIVIDYKNGVLVCRACGYVLDEFIVEYSASSGANLNGQYLTRQGTDIRYKYDLASNQFKLAEIRDRLRLADIIGFENNIFRDLDPRLVRRLATLLRNKCIDKTVKRLSKNEAAAFLYLAYTVLEDEYPFIAEVAIMYNISRSRARSLMRKVKKCLPTPSIINLIQ